MSKQLNNDKQQIYKVGKIIRRIPSSPDNGFLIDEISYENDSKSIQRDDETYEKVRQHIISCEQDGYGIAAGYKSTDGSRYKSRIDFHTEEIMKLIQRKQAEALENGFKRGFKDAENIYRKKQVIAELKYLLKNVPMSTLSYEQVEHRIATLSNQLENGKK